MHYEELLQRFSKDLPGEKAHLEFMPSRMASSLQIKEGVAYRNASVAIILFHQQDGKLATIVIKRQVYEGSHSGQISFPGGKQDFNDPDLLYTACRECKEEIGIDPSSFQVLKQLTPLYVPVSGFLIAPFVFYANQNSFPYIKSEREVQEIYEVDLERLFLPEALILKEIDLGNKMKIKNIQHFKQGKIEIWGATALILNELKQILR